MLTATAVLVAAAIAVYFRAPKTAEEHAPASVEDLPAAPEPAERS